MTVEVTVTPEKFLKIYCLIKDISLDASAIAVMLTALEEHREGVVIWNESIRKKLNERKAFFGHHLSNTRYRLKKKGLLRGWGEQYTDYIAPDLLQFFNSPQYTFTKPGN